MNEYQVRVYFASGRMNYNIGTLIKGDYNSSKLVFTFDDDTGIKMFELLKPDGITKWVKEIVNNEIVLADTDELGETIPLLTQEGTYIFEVAKYDGNSKLTSVKGKFKVKDEQVSTSDIPLEEVSKVELDDLINDVAKAVKEAAEATANTVDQANYAKEQGDYAKDQAQVIIKANEAAAEIVKEFDANAESKIKSYNENASTKLKEYNDNATSKLSEYNTNHETKTTTFDNNAKDKTDIFNTNVTDKTTEFNSNAEEKTTDFNNNATAKLEEYNANAETKVNEFNSNIDNLKQDLEDCYNNMLTAEAEGTFIHIEDSAKARLKELSVDGVCEQSLLPNEYQEVEYIKSTGTQYIDTGIKKIGRIVGSTLIDNNTRDLQFLIGTNNNTSEITLRKNNESKFYIRSSKSGVINEALVDYTKDTIINFDINYNGDWSFGNQNGTFTNQIDQSTNTINAYLFAYNNKGTVEKFYSGNLYKLKIFNSSGVLVRDFIPCYRKNDNVIGLYDLINNQFYTNAGSGTFEKGNEIPNPDYPQEIKTIEGNLNITSCNKNIIPVSTISNTTKNGITLTNNEDGSYTLNGTSTGVAFTLNRGGIKIFNGKTYTLSLNANKVLSSGDWYIGFKDGISRNNILGTSLTLNNSIGSITGTANDDYDDCDLFIWIGSGRTLDNYIIRPQLEESLTATPYEQHLETQITANLPEGEFIGKINDTYKDTLKVEYNEEDGQYHLNLYKSIRKKVLNGSETINNYNSDFGDDTIGFTIKLTDMNKDVTYNKLGTICTRFTFVSTWANDEEGYNNDLNTIIIRIKKSRLKSNDIAGFKIWLSTNNVDVYYALDEPYILDLGVVDMPKTYKGVSNIILNANIESNIKVKYVQSTNIVVDNLAKAIVALGGEV